MIKKKKKQIIRDGKKSKLIKSTKKELINANQKIFYQTVYWLD